MALNLTEGQVVLCTVKKIEKTNIFLDIEGNGEGSMVLSEVVAGRIRNLREYIVPNKKVVCKVLNISNGHAELSLRRVTGKEKQEVLERYKKERSLTSMLKNIAPNPEELVEKIKKDYDVLTFFEEAREDPPILKKFFTKEQIEKLSNILAEKIEKGKEVKKLFKLSSTSPEGLISIKEVLDIPNTEIHYLGSSQFSISAKAKDFKEANKNLLIILQNIEKKAKERKLNFELVEK